MYIYIYTHYNISYKIIAYVHTLWYFIIHYRILSDILELNKS